ncbi:hypothetical protein FSP39_018056 [Pinctada imbricata]|uniref:Hexosyltransferase n=1 Tax=Pinctada imbricata TaxID=66713 RepID=A0AA88XDJ4_PINIB|nr:hypothetical protein FSP39_018056 [Pinctada imbricata]
MKVDDDMWVNIDLLYGMMKSGLFRNSLTGSCNYASRPFRNKKSKYYVSYSMYPDHVYPPFCSGTGYILDFAVMEDIVNVSKNIPFFPLEDVYIGFCMRELGKSVVTMMSFHSFKIFLNSCIYKSEIILTSHGLSASDLIDIWNTPCNFPKFHGNILAFQGRGLGAEPKGLPRRQFMHRNRQMGLRRQQLHGKGPKNYNFRLPVKRPVKYRKRPGI